MYYLIETEQWSVENNIKIETMKEDIKKITKGLLDFILQTDKLEKARLMLRKVERSLYELIHVKNNLLINSAENYASMQQQRYLISKVTYKPDREKFWSSDSEFESEQDLELINRLTKLFFEESRMGSRTIRSVARSYPWKLIWVSSKSNNTLFNLSPSEWTDNQKSLIYWSNIYDNVMESHERPSNRIIEDDDLMDSWFIRQADKMESQTNKNNINNMIKDNGKPGRKETFIVTDPQSAKEVYSMNDPHARVKLKAKEKMIVKHGALKEQDSPDSQEEMRTQITKQFMKKGR
jgi:frataxin-like iron-binding protein CyaY